MYSGGDFILFQKIITSHANVEKYKRRKPSILLKSGLRSQSGGKKKNNLVWWIISGDMDGVKIIDRILLESEEVERGSIYWVARCTMPDRFEAPTHTHTHTFSPYIVGNHLGT